MVFYYRRSCDDALKHGLFSGSARHFARLARDFFAESKSFPSRLARLLDPSWTPEDHVRDQWCAEGQRMRLWVPRGHNCIYSDSTLGLWMHRCAVAEQCDLIAAACAASTFVLSLFMCRKGKQARVGPIEIGNRKIAHPKVAAPVVISTGHTSRTAISVARDLRRRGLHRACKPVAGLRRPDCESSRTNKLVRGEMPDREKRSVPFIAEHATPFRASSRT